MKQSTKYWLISIGITLLLFGGGLWYAYEPREFGEILLSEDEIKWKDFTDNLENIEYEHNGKKINKIKDGKGIWQPTQDDFKEIYKYVYGYDLVPWQKADGTEMSPLVVGEDGRKYRTNLIPNWEQEWNNAKEIGDINGDVLKAMLDNTIVNVKDNDIFDEGLSASKKEKKNIFSFLKKFVKSALAAVNFSDGFTVASTISLQNQTPDTAGSGWTELIDNGGCDLKINAAGDYLSGGDSSTVGLCSADEGALCNTDDYVSTKNYEVSVTQTNGDTDDDMTYICCRIQDANNMYCLRFNESDADLVENTSGSWGIIENGGSGIADGSTVELICNGSTISAEDDGSEILSVSDSTNSYPGQAGIGLGDIGYVNDDASAQQIDNFQVNSLANEIIFNDSCTVGSNTSLGARTPDTGTGWTRILQGNDGDVGCAQATDVFYYMTSGNSHGALYETDDDFEADQVVEIQPINGDTVDDWNILACRIQADGSMYAVMYNESDADIWRSDAGSWTNIVSGATGITDYSSTTLSCIGTEIMVLDDGVPILTTTTESTITGHGNAGYGMGGGTGFPDTSGDISGQTADDFTVYGSIYTPPAEGGAPANPANIIIFD
jgi:hypothetical protein